MEEDRNAVDNVEYDDEENETIDMLDQELVNRCINMEGNLLEENGQESARAVPLPIDAIAGDSVYKDDG